MFWPFKKEKKSDFDEKMQSIDQNIKTSFENIKNDMRKVSDWITTLDSRDGTNEKRINYLEDKIEHLSSVVEQSKMPKEAVERSNEAFEQDKNERVFTRVQSFNRSVQPFMNVHEHTDLEVLTPAQKQVIALLTYSGGPMGYDEISKGLGINEVTARRHINDIRRAGFSIKRKVSVNNRRNVFYLDKEVRESIVNSAEKPKKSDK